MKHKVKMILLILIGLLISLGIGIGKTIAVNNYSSFGSSVKLGFSDLKTYTNILCIANGYTLNNSKSEYTVKNTVTITPDTGGKSNAKMAYYCFYASNLENYNGSDYTNSRSQNAMWRYWKTWYDANWNNKYNTNSNASMISTLFNIRSKADNNSQADALEEEAEKYYNVLSGNEGITIINKNATSDSATVGKGNNAKTYTYIGPFRIKVAKRYSDYVTDPIKGFSVPGATIQGYANEFGEKPSAKLPGVNEKFYIVCNKTADITVDTEITLEYEIWTYSATMKLLYNKTNGKAWQNLAWVTGTKNKGKAETTFNIRTEGEQEVSLQKYIVGVNGVNNLSKDYFISGNQASTGRRNLIANADYTGDEDKDISYNRNVSNTHNQSKYYKINNPVIINKGDTVVYKIVVYNNGASATKRAYIKDRISSQGELLGIYSKLEDGKLKGVVTTIVGENQYCDSDLGDEAAYKTTNNYKYFKWHIDDSSNTAEIPPNSSKEYYVQVKYDEFFTGKIANKAWIYSSNASEEKRTIDFDYIQMRQSDVSLQKYITQVNGANVKSSRIDKRANSQTTNSIYKTSSGAVKNSVAGYKYDSIVDIEVGDYVTYNITVYNNSSTPVTNIQVIDEIPSGATLYRWGGYSSNKAHYSFVPNDGRVIYTISELKGYQTYTINITLYFGNFQPNVIQENFAVIKDTDNGIDTEYRVADSDYVRMLEYKAKLEKYISKAYSLGGMIRFDQDIHYFTWRYGNAEYGASCSDSGGNKNYKANNPVTVQNRDVVTYDIKVTNEGNTQIYLQEIIDNLPEGLEYNLRYGTVSGEKYGKEDDAYWIGNKISNITGISYNGQKITFNKIALTSGQCIVIHLPVQVTEPNISVRIIKNTASLPTVNKKYIVTNKNNFSVYDSCQTDDIDSDYIQLTYGDTYAVIAGKVWNDKALNKTQNNYDGLYEQGDEQLLPGIKVTLIRKTNTGTVLVSSKYTNSSGQYAFFDRDINKFYSDKDNKNYTTINYIKNDYEKYIKGPRDTANKKWTGTHYSYYVMFEYDGVTYTSTPDGNSYKQIYEDYGNGNYKNNSNAREKLTSTSSFTGYVQNNRTDYNRTDFNNSFNTVHNKSGIHYDTKNATDSIPQSNHRAYDDSGYLLDKYKMYSSTNLITLDNSVDRQTQIQYINLGLRGRDIFDLELTSDVDNVKVTVNNQEGVYNYTNKVTIQRSDLSSNYSYDEDMANTYLEGSSYIGEEQELKIRKGDLNPETYAGTNTGDSNKYDTRSQAVNKIEVTYKITVTNASETVGTATKVIDYYDSRYTFERAYIGDTTLSTEAGETGTGFKSVIITTTGSQLTQSDTMDIYVVYRLNEPTTTLSALLSGTPRIPTYNMAEIYAYKTKSYAGTSNANKEFTRGLIDKDSAPGSANQEQVRLTSTQNQATATTVGYYFGGNNLNALKYEDDTYATPTLYFTTPSDNDKNNYDRKITGTVFEDYTVIVNTNGQEQTIRTKTGDGVKNEDEPCIEGVKVLLIDEDGIPRYRDYTDKNGDFSFSGFLPGEYFITFDYGNNYGENKDTFLYDNNPNTKSYNGEDFQSTNNKYKVDGANVNILNTTDKFWYAFNKSEGVSTAEDRINKRQEVSKNVTNFNDYEMTVLNNARDGKTAEEAKVEYTDENGESKTVTVQDVREKTYMTAQTEPILLTVEETVELSKISNSDKLIKNRIITDKGNGLGEWAVFPNPNRTYYKSYNISNMNFGIAEVPVTTIDLQKHVKSFTITDSAGTNTIASAEMDDTNSIVTVNPSKIASNRIDRIIKVLSKNLNMEEKEIKNKIKYNSEDASQNSDTNIVITQNATEDQVKQLQYDMTMYSLSREITITKSWKVTSGNVLAAPGASVIDVSIEDEQLQGAKLEVTYEITCSMYAEKNYDNTEAIIASITGIADYIDNDLSYNANSNENNPWTVTTRDEVIELYKKAAEFNEASYGDRLGTLDPEGSSYTTIVSANADSEILLTDCGTATAEVTLERVLSATDSSLGDILTSSIDTFEYDNSIEITGLDYQNTQSGDFVYRDRIRTTDRYIILAGIQHDTATSEAISIHPPTGKNNNIVYYVIAVTSLGILTIGIVLIRKYVIKK